MLCHSLCLYFRIISSSLLLHLVAAVAGPAVVIFIIIPPLFFFSVFRILLFVVLFRVNLPLSLLSLTTQY